MADRRDGRNKVSAEEAARAAELFAAAVKESDRLDKAKRERERAERAERDRVEAERSASARALADARRELDRAISAVRRAKESGKGRADADAAWKLAKASVIELETGARPAWAPAPAAEPSATDHDVASPDTIESDTEPADSPDSPD